jgi:rhodanese-related sulfurtransferase
MFAGIAGKRGEVMPVSIDRTEVQRLLQEEAAQVIEVLPTAEYEEQHIAGAINIPLKKLDRSSTANLQNDRPIITYCHDFQ